IRKVNIPLIVDPPQPSQAKFPFFSLPPEICFHIYGYLAPNRIHILPNAKARKVPYKPWLDNEKVHPWALASVSRQFRAEIRFIVYAVSVIEIHLRGKYESKYESEARAAYRAWITNLHEELAARIKHLVLDDLVNIDWKPDGPVPERPMEIARREMMQRLREKDERGENLLEIEAITWDPLFEGPAVIVVGNWEARWVEHFPRWETNSEAEDETRVERIRDELRDIEMAREAVGEAVVGLGKAGIRGLVAAYWGDEAWEIWSERSVSLDLCQGDQSESEEEEEESEDDGDDAEKCGDFEGGGDPESDYPEEDTEEEGDADGDTDQENESEIDWDLNVAEEMDTGE
ncbi:MAG: hypothetical protein LQ349_006407, partial [Xanthoria aureola]